MAICMNMGGTSMCFVGGHLASGKGEQNQAERIDDWEKTRDNLSFHEVSF